MKVIFIHQCQWIFCMKIDLNYLKNSMKLKITRTLLERGTAHTKNRIVYGEVN